MRIRLSYFLYIFIFAVPFDQFKFAGILSASNILIIIMTVAIFSSNYQGYKIIFNKANTALIGIFIISLISLISSDIDLDVFRGEITLLSGILIFFLIERICLNELIYRQIITNIFKISTFVSILAIAQYFFWVLTGDVLYGKGYTGYYSILGGFYVFKSSAFFTGGLILGYYLLFSVVCGTYILLSSRNLKHRFLIKMVVTLSVIAIFFTFSRGTWLTIIMFVCYIIFKKIRLMHKSLQYILLIPTIISFIAITLFSTDFLLNTMSPLSTYNRLGIINSSIQSIKNNPFFGRGLGSTVGQYLSDKQYNNAYQNIYKTHINAKLDIDIGKVEGRETHNTFLQVAVDLGILGLMFYLYFLYNIWKNSIISISKLNISNFDVVKKGVLLAFIFSMILSTFSSLFLLKQSWIIFGLVSAGSRLRKDSNNKALSTFQFHN